MRIGRAAASESQPASRAQRAVRHAYALIGEQADCRRQLLFRLDVARHVVQLVLANAQRRQRPVASINARYF
jgi:hypothetical protein